MSAKTTYTATAFGVTATRKSERTYTHAIMTREEGRAAGVWGFCGSMELAQKKAASIANQFAAVGKAIEIQVVAAVAN